MKWHIALFAVACLQAAPLCADDWHLESDADGIKVYSRKEKDSPVLSFRGEGLVNFPVEAVYKVLENPNNYAHWMPMVVRSKVLQEISSTEKTVALQIGMPWPVKDRAFTNLGKVKKLADQSYILEIKSIASQEAHPDLVEGWTHYSYVKIEAVESGQKTRIELELNQDPRGSIPKFLVNLVQSSWPRDFFNNIVKFMGKNRQPAGS